MAMRPKNTWTDIVDFRQTIQLLQCRGKRKHEQPSRWLGLVYINALNVFDDVFASNTRHVNTALNAVPLLNWQSLRNPTRRVLVYVRSLA